MEKKALLILRSRASIDIVSIVYFPGSWKILVRQKAEIQQTILVNTCAKAFANSFKKVATYDEAKSRKSET